MPAERPMRIPKAGQTWMVFIRGFQAAGRGFRYTSLPERMEREVSNRLFKVWKKLFNASQKSCPVGKTGKLKRSGRVINKSRPTGKQGKQFIDMRITYGGPSTDCVYSVYVHEGHRGPGGKGWVRGRPWLVRAAKRYRKSLYRECKYALRDEWSKFARQLSGYKGHFGPSQLGYKTRTFGMPAGSGTRLGAFY